MLFLHYMCLLNVSPDLVNNLCYCLLCGLWRLLHLDDQDSCLGNSSPNDHNTHTTISNAWMASLFWDWCWLLELLPLVVAVLDLQWYQYDELENRLLQLEGLILLALLSWSGILVFWIRFAWYNNESWIVKAPTYFNAWCSSHICFLKLACIFSSEVFVFHFFQRINKISCAIED